MVPTATTRPPASRVARTAAAVAPGTANHSGCGASPASCDENPVWSVTGTTPMPRATSRVTRSGVKGRAALGISALPGRTENTVW